MKRIAFTLVACVFVLALAAFFLAHDSKAAALLFTMGVLAALITSAGSAGRSKFVDSVQETDKAD
jgi:hypothetical protein